jgi:AbrB family looped-hinge helix DNA binding protein
MTQSATVTSKSMINIPAKVRKKYGIKAGTKVLFAETELGIKLIPVPSISELFGIDRERKEALLEAIRELEEEHRSERME